MANLLGWQSAAAEPEKQIEAPSETNPFGSLFKTMNSVGATYERAQAFKAVKGQHNDDPTFTNDNFKKALSGIDDVNTRIFLLNNNVESWDTFYGLLEFKKREKEHMQNVAANFSTAEQLIYGLPMALVDADLLVGGPITKIGRLGYETASTVGKVARGAATGSAFAVTSMANLNVATGEDIGNHTGTAALLGMALGGTLAKFGEHSSNVAKPQYVDTVDNSVYKTAEEARVAQLQKHEDEINSLNEAMGVHSSISESIGSLQKQIKEFDPTKASENNSFLNTIRTNLDEVAATTQKELDDLIIKEKEVQAQLKESVKANKELYKTHTEVSTNAETKLKELQAEFIKHQTNASTRQATLEKIQELQALVDKSKAARDYHIAKVDEFKASPDYVPRQKNTVFTNLKNILKEAKENLATNKRMLSEHNNLLKTLNESVIEKRLTKAREDYSTLKSEYGLYKQDANSKLQLNGQAITEAKKEIQAIKNQKIELQAKIKEAKANIKELPKDSKAAREYLDKLNAKLDSAKSALLPDNFKALLEKRGMLTEDLVKMSAKDFTIDNFKRLQIEKKSAVQTMMTEFKEAAQKIKTLEALQSDPNFKFVPSWMKKVLISPIARAMNSNNSMVSGLAQKLDSSTLYQGLLSNVTAMGVRRNLDSKLKDFSLQLRTDYLKYKESVNSKVTEEEYHSMVMNEARQVINRMQSEAIDAIPGGLDSAKFREIVTDRLNKAQKQFTNGLDGNVKNSVSNFLKYFEDMHARGNKLELEGFMKSAGQGYLPRIYDSNKIAAMEKESAGSAEELLYQAQYKYALKSNEPITPELLAEFRASAKNTVEMAVDNERRLKDTVHLIEHGRQSAGRQKERSLRLLDEDIRGILNDDIFGVLHSYAMATHGKFALKETIGVRNLNEFESLLREAKASSEDADNLKVVVQTILGTREVDKNPYNVVSRGVKGVSTLSSLTNILGFAVPSLMELGTIVGEYGAINTAKKFLKSNTELHEIYAKGEATDVNTVWLLSDFGEALVGHKAIRNEAEGYLDSVGKIQNNLDKWVTKGALYGGLQPVTDSLRLLSASLTTDFVARMSVKGTISKAERIKLEEMGISDVKLAEIQKVLDVSPEGVIRNRDRASWGNTFEEMQRVVDAMVRKTVLHPTASSLPKIMTDYSFGGIMPRLLFKFMRFPVESYERLLLRGIQTADFDRLAGIGVSAGIGSLILLAKDALKPEDKQKFREDTEESRQEFYKSLLFVTPVLAGATTGADVGMNILTGKTAQGYRGSMSPVTSMLDQYRQGMVRSSLPFGSAKMNIDTAVDLENLQAEVKGEASIYNLSTDFDVLFGD